MGEVVSLADYRNNLSVRSIASRLVRLGHEANAVRKTIATILVEHGRTVSVAELWTLALRHLDEHQSQREARTIYKPRAPHHAGVGRVAMKRALRLVIWDER